MCDSTGSTTTRDPRLLRQKPVTTSQQSVNLAVVNLDEAEKKRLNQQREYIRKQQEELFRKQTLLDEEACKLEDQILKRDEEQKQLVQSDTTIRKRHDASKPETRSLPKISKLKKLPLNVDEVYGDDEERDFRAYGPGTRPTTIIAECVKAAVKEAMQEREKICAIESKKAASELKQLRDLMVKLQRDLNEARCESRSSSRSCSSYEQQVSLSESERREIRREIRRADY